MFENLCETLKKTTVINNIQCKFDCFSENNDTLKCTIQFPSGSGLTIDMFKQYLKELNFELQIEILQEGILTGANSFSLSDKQYASLLFRNSK
jgi:hypothetical protein